MRNNLSVGSQPNRTIGDFPIENDNVSQDWSQQKHTAEVVMDEARHLVQAAGTAELAKQAIDAVTPPSAAKEELAHDLGYDSVRAMMEQTEVVPLPGGSFMYLTTDSDNYWVAWRDKSFYDIQRFDSRLQAISCLQECPDWLTIES
jgi:hypothetical protein